MKTAKQILPTIYLLFIMILSSCTQPSSQNSESTSNESSLDSLVISSEISSEEISDDSLSNNESSPINSSSEDLTTSSELQSDESSSESEEEIVMKRLTYTNSVYNYDFPDPAGVYDPLTKAWYLYATGMQIIKSTNGVNWEKIQPVFSTTPNWGTPNAGFWAPEVQYIGGQYVMYYSLSTWGDANPGFGVASAPTPSGPWTDHGKLFRSLEIGVNNSIDAGVFVAEDGRVFMVWGSMRGNYMVELTSDGLALKDGTPQEASKNKVRVAGLDTSYGWTVDTYEGAYVRYYNGYYYLFLSMGTCCDGANSTYQVVVGRSSNPQGPYVDHLGRDMKAQNVGKPLLAKNDFFVGTGHNSVIDDVNGDSWMYYHAYNKNNIERGRVLLMERIYFDAEGWPYVNGATPSTSIKFGPYYQV